MEQEFIEFSEFRGSDRMTEACIGLSLRILSLIYVLLVLW